MPLGRRGMNAPAKNCPSNLSRTLLSLTSRFSFRDVCCLEAELHRSLTHGANHCGRPRRLMCQCLQDSCCNRRNSRFMRRTFHRVSIPSIVTKSNPTNAELIITQAHNGQRKRSAPTNSAPADGASETWFLIALISDCNVIEVQRPCCCQS